MGAKRKVIQGDLVWPVNRVRRDMSKSFKKRPSREAAIYMAAVAEYCVAELLEISGDQTQKDKKKRISPRAIFKAVTGDVEFSKFLKGVQIAKSGSLRKRSHSVYAPQTYQRRTGAMPSKQST